MRSFSKFVILTSVSIAAVLVMVGCSDNPKSKAAKKANEVTDEAARSVEVSRYDTGTDYDNAYKKVESAMKSAKLAGGEADSVYLVAGQISSAQAEKALSKISDFEDAVIDKIKSVGDEILDYVALESKHETYSMLDKMASSENEALESVISGNDKLKGIKAKLSDSAKQLSELEAQLKDYQQKAEDAKEKAQSIQYEADRLLRKAELLTGDERLALEKQAYNMIKGNDSTPGKIHYSADVQKYSDLADTVQERISKLNEFIEKLKQDEARVTKRIAELSDNDRKIASAKDKAALESDMSELKSKIDSTLDDVSVALEAYEDQVKVAIDAYVAAQSDYLKVRSRNIRDLSKVSSAEVGSQLAQAYSDCVLFYSRLDNYLQSYVSIDSDVAADRIEELSHNISAKLEQTRSDMLNAYDKTLESFEGVITSGADEGLKVRAVREFLILSSQRLRIAQDARDQELFDSLIKKIQDYKNIAIEADPYFSKSLPARLLSSYGIEFKTKEEKLQEKYAALREEFVAVESLDDAQKQETLISLVDQLYKLDRPKNAKIFDDLVKYVLNTYKDELIAIKTANPEMESLEIFGDGLEVEQAPEAGEYDTGSDMFGEPNNY